MKRGWIGGILLLCLLLGGALSSRYMLENNETLSRKLETAGTQALRGDWAAAEAALRVVRQSWEQNWQGTAFFADHGPMEEIDGLFAQLEVYGKTREATTFAAACAELGRQLEAMGDAHALSWENLF